MHLILCLALLLISPFEAADKKSKKKVNKPPPPDDLVIQSLSEDSEGCEPTTQEGNVLRVHYIGRIYATDEEFDNTYERGEPFEFVLGHGQVIKGWDKGLTEMCPGEKRRLIIPAKLAYGHRGVSDLIPPDAVLEYDIELLDFQLKKKKKLTAKQRLDKKKRAWKRQQMMKNMDMETRPDGSQVVNFAGFRGDDSDDYSGFEL